MRGWDREADLVLTPVTPRTRDASLPAVAMSAIVAAKPLRMM
jgi:hypothetical protein